MCVCKTNDIQPQKFGSEKHIKPKRFWSDKQIKPKRFGPEKYIKHLVISMQVW